MIINIFYSSLQILTNESVSACHVFNCFGDACEVVSTIGEAFSIKYDDVLSKHAQYNPAFEFIELNKNDG